jgi:hypothetical protein
MGQEAIISYEAISSLLRCKQESGVQPEAPFREVSFFRQAIP